MLKVFFLIFASLTNEPDLIYGVYLNEAVCIRALTVAGKLEKDEDFKRLSCVPGIIREK